MLPPLLHDSVAMIQTWADKDAYDVQAAKLVQMFVKTFATFEAHVDGAVLNAAPAVRMAAE